MPETTEIVIVPARALETPVAPSMRAPPATVFQAILAVVGLAVFGLAVGNGFTDWDDDIYVTRNPLITDPSLEGVFRCFTTFHACNYHPLTYLTYMAEHALVGLDPWLYHLDSVLIHIAASIVAFQLARRWLSSDGGAFLTALLFLVHPLRVESVAWVAERKDVLCAFFYLASLLAYTKHLDDGSVKARRWALGLFVLALLSKVMAVTLPAALVVLLVARREAVGPRLRELLPFAALGIVFAVIGILAQASSGAVQGLHGGGISSHVSTVLMAVSFYAVKLAVPATLSPRYVIEPASGPFEAGVLAGAALAALLALAAARSFPRSRTAFLGIGFFAITWAPVSGFVPSSTIVADRYLYLPAFGLFLALAGPLAALAARRAPGGRVARVGVASVLILACVYGIAAARRVPDWRDGLTLWSSALLENPDNPFAHNQLFLAHHESGRAVEAEAAADRAVKLGLAEPKHVFNLCLAYRELGDGEREIARAREILGGTPDFIPAWLVVLRHEREAGRLEAAEDTLSKLLEKHPGDAGLWGARAELSMARGNAEEALLGYLRSIELRAGDLEVLLGTAATLMALGDGERALDLASRSLAMPRGALHAGPRARLRLLLEGAERSGNAAWAERARELAGPVRGS